MEDLLKGCWRSVLENAPGPIVIVDSDGIILFANYSVPGLEIEDVIGKSQLDFVEKKYHDLVVETVKYVFRTGNDGSYKVEGLGASGNIALYETQIRPVRNNGDIIAGALFVRDITESNLAREAIRETDKLRGESARLTAIIETTNDFVGTANPDSTLSYLNKAGRKMTGLSENEDVSKKKIINMHPEWASRIIGDEGIPTAMKDGVWKGETALKGADGSEIPVSQVIMTHKNKDGELEYISTIVRDITELKKAQEESKKAKDKLIEQQSAAILELSTPVIQIWDEIVVLPMIGTIDTARAQQVIEVLLDTIVSTQALVAIMDVTGVPVVDTGVANHFLKTIRAAKMLGTEVILTGVSPHNAQTLVKLGIEMKQITTKGSLQAGLKLAFEITENKVIKKKSGANNK